MEVLEIIILLIGSNVFTGIVVARTNWGIEKKRLKREYKQDLINEVRDFISNDFDKGTLRNSRVYGRIRPHLPEKLDKEIRNSGGITVVLGGGGIITAETLLKESIETTLARLEKDWNLI